MDEITLEGKTYVSSKRAAQITGYAKDYVGQLCREGRVLARLVGRNWYVLESSIREHRFGTEEKTVKTAGISENSTKTFGEKTPVSSWEPVSYTSETPTDPIPVLVPQEKSFEINVLEGRNSSYSYEKPEVTPVDSKIVKEMQSAWHDWFAKTNELSVSEEILLESPAETAPKASNSVDYSSFDHETTPITLEKVTELIEQKEADTGHASMLEDDEIETVRIRRSFKAPLQQDPQTFSNRIMGASKEIPSQMYQPIPSEGRVIHERRVVRNKKRKHSPLIKVSLLAIAVAAILITVVGSGYADNFVQTHHLNNAVIHYLGGESTFIRTSK